MGIARSGLLGLAVFNAKTHNQIFTSRSHFAKFLGNDLFFTGRCLRQFALELCDLLPAMTPAFDFLHAIADTTHYDSP